MQKRQVVIYRGEDGFWIAECLSLPGAISQGTTQAEALSNIEEAIALMLDTLQAYGDPIPEDHLDAVLVAI